MKDQDLLAGRKAILDFLSLSSWVAVEERIKEGLPVAKIGGRWEMSVMAYRVWKERKIGHDGVMTEHTESSLVIGVIRELPETEQQFNKMIQRLESSVLKTIEENILKKLGQTTSTQE